MPPFNALRFRFSQSLEIDRAVFFAVIGKIWSLPAGLITALLIAVFFSPELQGYYYTFNSVLAFQIFAELGLGTVLTYYASHEWAKLALDQHDRVTGDADAFATHQPCALRTRLVPDCGRDDPKYPSTRLQVRRCQA